MELFSHGKPPGFPPWITGLQRLRGRGMAMPLGDGYHQKPCGRFPMDHGASILGNLRIISYIFIYYIHWDVKVSAYVEPR